ncbi:MAG: nucleoside kinase [Spirochaetales bacterium]|jgi:uridine kinase|nr:nucleoside kinase [Spirochaetales bacterium]
MSSINIKLPSGETKPYPYAVRVRDILKEEPSVEKNRLVAALVNNELVSLSCPLETDSEICPVYTNDNRGVQVFRRSLSYLLFLAASECLPDKRLIISHSLGNGYYYYYEDGSAITPEEVNLLEKVMGEIVREGRGIHRRQISYARAAEYFKDRGWTGQALFLAYRSDALIPIYQCGPFWEMGFEPLVDNTAKLKPFELRPYGAGLLLRYPRTQDPDRIPPFTDNLLLYDIYREYKAWGKILNLDSVGKLNKVIHEKKIQAFIQVAEALHNKKIAEIADRIQAKRGSVKVVFIAGPSSSGKTTFCKKLAIQLRVLGFNPLIIGLDDYFLPRDQTPRDERGNPDWENLGAIDVELLNQNLLTLFDGGKITLPVYDFKTGTRRENGPVLEMGSRTILLVEGIHGLNDSLTPLIKAEQKFKIYISALTQLNIDGSNRIATTDNRLLRRIIRDNQFRGHDALKTLTMWDAVRAGEKKNIFPFQNNADCAFNSALDYELAVLKPYAELPLTMVKPWHDQYAEARRLLGLLSNFLTIPVKFVPTDSILREFVGDSDFKY